MNQELFAKINDIISIDPSGFYMGTWEDISGCGTTRCIAGWAVHLTTSTPLYGIDGLQHPAVLALADRLEVPRKSDDVVDFEDLGAALFGLTPEEASVAFYLDEQEAKEFVRLAATGREEAARALLDEVEG